MPRPRPPEVLTTRTGVRFQVRPATPADAPIMKAFFRHVSREDLRFRFLSGMNEVGDSQIRALTQVDHDRVENFLAFSDDGSTMIATAMLACDPGFERGEVAIAIRSDQKKQGVSWELLAYVARYAETKGVKTLESIESVDNHRAIELEREMGFTAMSCPGDATLMLVSRKLGARNGHALKI